jgi:hypothetical protein
LDERSFFIYAEQAPVFNNIDIMLSEANGRLKCSATGDPAPTLFWIQPNGRTTRYGPLQHHPHQQQQSASAALGADGSDGSRRTDGVLLLKPLSSSSIAGQSAGAADAGGSGIVTGGGAAVAGASGMYICIANNEAGNVTLAVNVSWPLFTGQQRQQQQHGTEGPHRKQQQQHFQSVTKPTPASSAVTGRSRPDAASDEENLSLTVNLTAVSHGVGGGGGNDARSSVGLAGVEDGVAATGRLFSVAEMICAVVVTHVATLVVCLLILAVFVQRRASKLRRQQQLLPPSLHVGGPSIAAAAAAGGSATGSTVGGGGLCLGGAGAGGYRLPPGTGSLCRPVPSYAAEYAVYDTQSRTTAAPFSYHLRPSMT